MNNKSNIVKTVEDSNCCCMVEISLSEYLKLQAVEANLLTLAEKYKQCLNLLYKLSKTEKRKELVELDELLKLDFDDEDSAKEFVQDEPELEKIEYTREKKKSKKRQQLSIPDNLERITEIIDPEIIPEGAVKIGEVVTEILECQPSKLYVRRIVRNK